MTGSMILLKSRRLLPVRRAVGAVTRWTRASNADPHAVKEPLQKQGTDSGEGASADSCHEARLNRGTLPEPPFLDLPTFLSEHGVGDG